MLETTIDLGVQVGYFKTFDMLAQGTYRLRLRASLISENQKKLYAQPYLILDNRFNPSNHNQKLFEAALQPHHQGAVTSSFFVRYCDQDCLLNQIAIFRFSIANGGAKPQPVTLEIDLQTLDLGENKDEKVSNGYLETSRTR